jgi:hypothetical protein
MTNLVNKLTNVAHLHPFCTDATGGFDQEEINYTIINRYLSVFWGARAKLARLLH